MVVPDVNINVVHRRLCTGGDEFGRSSADGS